MSKHSKDRIRERYNLELSYADEKNILRLLNKGQGMALDVESKDPNKKFAYVLYKHIPLKVLYEEGEKNEAVNIITSYPFDADEYNEVAHSIFKAHIRAAMGYLRKNGYIVYKKGSLKRALL